MRIYLGLWILLVLWAQEIIGRERGTGSREARRCSCSSSLSSAMAGVLELEPAAAPATVLESEGTGRERRARGFYFGDSGHGKRRSAPAAWQPWPRLMSLLVAGRGRGTGWGRPRVLWRSSAAAYLGARLPTGGDRRAAAAAREGEQRELDSGRKGGGEWWSWGRSAS